MTQPILCFATLSLIIFTKSSRGLPVERSPEDVRHPEILKAIYGHQIDTMRFLRKRGFPTLSQNRYSLPAIHQHEEDEEHDSLSDPTHIPNNISPDYNGCRTGWEKKCFPTGCFCYTVTKRYLNWSEASKECKRSGAELASIHSEEENDFAFSLQKASWDDMHREVWIGLTKTNSNETDSAFEWSDGTPVDYFNWHGSEGSHDVERCVVKHVWKGQNWFDYTCSVEIWSICKAPVLDAATESTAALVPDLVAEIPAASQSSQSLAVEPSPGDVPHSDNFISIYDNPVEPMQIDSLPETIRCGREFSNEEYEEYDSLPEPRFIPNNNISLDYNGCRIGWEKECFPTGCFCYTVMKRQLSWSQASKECKRSGAELASIHSEEENDFAFSLQKASWGSTLREVWIGLTKTNSNETDSAFEWSDGTPVDYFNWHGGEGLHDVERCVVTHVWKGQNWFDYTCSVERWSICKAPVLDAATENTAASVVDLVAKIPAASQSSQSFAVEPSPGDVPHSNIFKAISDNPVQPMRFLGFQLLQKILLKRKLDSLTPRYIPNNNIYLDSNGCRIGWENKCFPNGCFCYTVMKTYLSWSEASEECERSGAELASIHSEEENDFAFSLQKASWKSLNHEVWIGLTKINSTETGSAFEWSDGTPVDYFNWHGGEGSNDVERCVVKQAWSGQNWFDYTCSLPRWSICKAPVLDAATENPAASVVDLVAEIPVTSQSSQTLAVEPSSGDVRHWPVWPMRLLGLQELRNILRHGQIGSLLGILRRYGLFFQLPIVNEEYKENDSLPEPGYIPNNNISLDYNGCRIGWEKECFNTGCFCYTVMKTHLSWSEASKGCKRSGAELASIHSEEENDFAFSLQKASWDNMHREVWIGLTKTNSNETDSAFEWSDGTPVDYFNWHEGEGSHDVERCVVKHVWKGQNWFDYTCSVARWSICKAPVLDAATENPAASVVDLVTEIPAAFDD